MEEQPDWKGELEFPKVDPLYSSLSVYLRDTRELKGLGLPKIASVTGFHTSNLSRVERTVHQPTPDTLRQLSHPLAYGCPWWSSGQNQIFLLALAYHLTRSPHYAPRQLEWLPADMAIAEAAASIVFRGENWATVPAWPDLVEKWVALGLPGWEPPAEYVRQAPPPQTRPLWLWGAWSVTLQWFSSKKAWHDWLQNIKNRDDSAIAACIVGFLAARADEILQFRNELHHEPSTPEDPDFKAIIAAWPRLDRSEQRLLRQVAEALATKNVRQD